MNLGSGERPVINAHFVDHSFERIVVASLSFSGSADRHVLQAAADGARSQAERLLVKLLRENDEMLIQLGRLLGEVEKLKADKQRLEKVLQERSQDRR